MSPTVTCSLLARGNDFLRSEYTLHDKPIIFEDCQGTKPICRVGSVPAPKKARLSLPIPQKCVHIVVQSGEAYTKNVETGKSDGKAKNSLAKLDQTPPPLEGMPKLLQSQSPGIYSQSLV